MPFKLEEIETDEISLVEAPATKRKFLFRKQDEANRSLNGGFLVCPDCNHWEAITDFLKSAGEECSSCGANLIEGDAEIFFKGDIPMKKTLVELLTDFIGEDELEEDEIEEIKKAEEKMDASALKALKSAVNILNKYKDAFPDDVKKAIDVLAKAASKDYGYPAKKSDEDDEDIKKAGAKLSKTTLELIKKVVESFTTHEKTIQSLKSLLKSQTKKSGELEDLEKKVDSVLEQFDKLAKNKDKDTEGDEDEDKEKTLKEKLEKLQKRLEVVEKQGGVKKSLEGDDEETEEDEDKDKVKKEKPPKWSFTFRKGEDAEGEEEKKKE